MELKALEYKDRIINLFEDLNEDSVKAAVEKIVEINITDTEYINNVVGVISSCGFGVDPNNIQLPPIILNLNTYGGVCYDGFALCDSIRTSETPVKVICFGKVMSMGIPVLLSAKFKAAHKNTIFMIHGISFGSYGKAEHLRESIDETNRLEQQMVDYILSNSKFPKKKMNEIIKNQSDFYFTAEQALQWKIIDEII